jgi:hypothetical protein
MGFESLKRLLPTVVRSHGIGTQVEARRVLERSMVVLRALWGEERAGGVSAVSFRDGVLKLESTSPSALHMLRLEELKIRNAMNRDLGSLVVRKLDVRAKGF